jgi:hypothetical protein
MVCKGICIRHKAHKPFGSSRYGTGNKRCQICEIFIKWEGLCCPCCGYKLRIGPRHFRLKEKLKEQKRIEQAKEVTPYHMWEYHYGVWK